MKVLLELRPAFDGHSGIPQEARLLFRGLGHLPGIEVQGLIQSSNLVIEPGLRNAAQPCAVDGHVSADTLDRLSRVVVSLQQGPAASRLAHWRRRLLKAVGPLAAALRGAVGLSVRLGHFDPRHFKDFVWRALFAKSLPIEDFDAVTSAPYRILRWPWSLANAWGIATGTLGHALYPRLDTRGIDIFVAETPYPGRVHPQTRLVVRYHDAIPLLMPHTIKNRGHHRAMHLNALRRNAADGAWFACVSNATRDDLLTVLPELGARAVTIPNMISHHFVPETESCDRVPEIIWSRKNRRAPHEGGAAIDPTELRGSDWPYLLMVATIEPRKNHLALLDAWELLRSSGYPQLHLVCVGHLGWEHQAILDRFAPWLRRGGLHLLEDVPATDLRLLYRHARATVAPSFGEGFDFAGVEAMRSGGLVVASDIRVHREVYGDAAEYFSPYSSADLAAAVARVIAPDQWPRRDELRARGAEIAAQYLPERVLPQWQRFLRDVAATPARR